MSSKRETDRYAGVADSSREISTMQVLDGKMKVAESTERVGRRRLHVLHMSSVRGSPSGHGTQRGVNHHARCGGQWSEGGLDALCTPLVSSTVPGAGKPRPLLLWA